MFGVCAGVGQSGLHPTRQLANISCEHTILMDKIRHSPEAGLCACGLDFWGLRSL